MGRLLASGLVVIGALVVVLVVNGEGRPRPAERAAAVPGRSSSRTASASATPVRSPPAVKPAAVVRMRGLRFRPARVAVTVGQVVRFVNDDNVAHTVFEDFGPRSGEIAVIDTQRILPGESFDLTARARGVISYVCTLHPTVMSGRIRVVKVRT